ncbi:MAG: DUF4920 domain-containing protein [Cyclobacteriaceae bacterium]
MNKILLGAFVLGLMASCGDGGQNEKDGKTEGMSMENVSYYGDTIKTSGAIQAMDLVEELGKTDSREMTVRGTIKDVCQAKGCWMTVELGDGETMRVTFKDYGFFVPKDAAGKTVVFEGVAEKELVDVETQRHYAADAGQSEKEIESITEPKPEITFVAEGVAFPEGEEGI